MRLDPKRIAYRYLEAGVFEAPPAMHKAILEWVYAYVASKTIQEKEKALASAMQPQTPERNIAIESLQVALDKYRAQPTDWKSYKEVYEQGWIFGNMGSQWSIRDFQKLTPEKKEILTQRGLDLVARLEERIEADKNQTRLWIAERKQEVAKLKPYIQPDVIYKGDVEVTRQFPIDLTGWKSGQEEIERKIQERAKEEALRIVDLFDGNAAVRDAFAKEYAKAKKQLETGLGYYDHITVMLSTENTPGARAYWQSLSKTIVISIPHYIELRQLDGLSETLRHELQHFAQSYLTTAISGDKDVPLAGMPSRKIQTPEFKQHLSPKHPSFKDSPEVQKVFRRLREQGLDPSNLDMHSLDDVEFYTKLADSIGEFKRALSNAPDGNPNIALKLFTGAIRTPEQYDYKTVEDWFAAVGKLGGYAFIKWFPLNTFFRTLKKHALPKWRKAVSELINAAL